MTPTLVVDTSSLIAMMLMEPEAPEFEIQISREPCVVMAQGTAVEFGTVIRRRFHRHQPDFALRYIASLGIKVFKATARQARLAIEGGYKYPILNLGDTFAYALAKDLDVPLLYKGNDFSQTDVKRP